MKDFLTYKKNQSKVFRETWQKYKTNDVKILPCSFSPNSRSLVGSPIPTSRTRIKTEQQESMERLLPFGLPPPPRLKT